MLMAWGPFRFTIPTYSVEEIRRSLQPRTSPVPVIGRAPPIHKLGPGNEQITLSSTFHPHHLNGRGLAQLASIRQAINAQATYPLVHVNGRAMNIFGSWTGVQIDDSHSLLDVMLTPGTVTVSMSLMREDSSPARAIAIAAAADFSLGLGVNASFSIRLGF